MSLRHKIFQQTRRISALERKASSLRLALSHATTTLVLVQEGKCQKAVMEDAIALGKETLRNVPRSQLRPTNHASESLDSASRL